MPNGFRIVAAMPASPVQTMRFRVCASTGVRQPLGRNGSSESSVPAIWQPITTTPTLKSEWQFAQSAITTGTSHKRRPRSSRALP
jgi:hypothetical protein